MRANAHDSGRPKQGEAVAVGGREAVFLYQRGAAAVVRYRGESASRVVLSSKVRRRAA